MVRRKKVTMSDIADRLNVSIVTVSKALAGKDGVSEQLRDAIRQTAGELGYQVPSEDKETRLIEKAGSNLNLGILVADHYFQNSNSFYFDLYQLMVKKLADLGHYGIVEIVSAQEETACLPPNFLKQRHVSGVIVLGQFSLDYLEAVKRYEVPLIFVDFNYPEQAEDCIVQDNVNGGFIAVRYLMSRGHRKIGFVGSIRSTSSIMERYLGFHRAMLTYNLELKPCWMLEDRDDSGLFIQMRLPEELPTALICNSDETAYILIRQLAARGIRVPQDISIVGFDNSSYSRITVPRLTTIAVDADTMVTFAVKDLLHKIRRGDEGWRQMRKVARVSLIERDSVRDAGRTGNEQTAEHVPPLLRDAGSRKLN